MKQDNSQSEIRPWLPFALKEKFVSALPGG